MMSKGVHYSLKYILEVMMIHQPLLSHVHIHYTYTAVSVSVGKTINKTLFEWYNIFTHTHKHTSKVKILMKIQNRNMETIWNKSIGIYIGANE